MSNLEDELADIYEEVFSEDRPKFELSEVPYEPEYDEPYRERFPDLSLPTAERAGTEPLCGPDITRELAKLGESLDAAWRSKFSLRDRDILTRTFDAGSLLVAGAAAVSAAGSAGAIRAAGAAFRRTYIGAVSTAAAMLMVGLDRLTWDQLGHLAGGWDVIQLNEDEAHLSKYRPPCMTIPRCARGNEDGWSSVFAIGRCWDPGEPNYVLLGWVNRLISGESLTPTIRPFTPSLIRGRPREDPVAWTAMELLARVHKLKYRLERGESHLQAALSWLRAGWNGWPTWVPEPPTRPFYPSCLKQCTKAYEDTLTARLRTEFGTYFIDSSGACRMEHTTPLGTREYHLVHRAQKKRSDETISAAGGGHIWVERE